MHEGQVIGHPEPIDLDNPGTAVNAMGVSRNTVGLVVADRGRRFNHCFLELRHLSSET
jgi:hypothetical protein